MRFNEAKARVALRWVHIILGAVLLCYVYSPFSAVIPFRIFVKWVAIPVIVISGIWIWKFKTFNKWFRLSSN